MTAITKKSSPFENTHLSPQGPAYPMPPYTYRDARTLTVTLRTTPQTLQALVPTPLEINSEGVLRIYIGSFQITEPLRLRYHEAALAIPAAYQGKQGAYLPVLYLDHTLPILTGREIWGFPKFDADISLTEDEGAVRASVSKEGVNLINAEMPLSSPQAPPAVPARQLFFLLKTIPSVNRDAPPDVRQLCSAHLCDQVFTQWRPAAPALRLGSAPEDPLEALPVAEVLHGVYCSHDFVLDYGEVLQDYLAPT